MNHSESESSEQPTPDQIIDRFDFSDRLFESGYSFDSDPTMFHDRAGESRLPDGRTLEEYLAEGEHSTRVAELEARQRGLEAMNAVLDVREGVSFNLSAPDPFPVETTYQAVQAVQRRVAAGEADADIRAEVGSTLTAVKHKLQSLLE